MSLSVYYASDTNAEDRATGDREYGVHYPYLTYLTASLRLNVSLLWSRFVLRQTVLSCRASYTDLRKATALWEYHCERIINVSRNFLPRILRKDHVFVNRTLGHGSSDDGHEIESITLSSGRRRASRPKPNFERSLRLRLENSSTMVSAHSIVRDAGH